jgi:3D (Asp-Asp-Asp) domain-containing protein
MLKIIITLLLTTLCYSEEYIARVTYYWPGNGGQVGYQTSTGKRPSCGKTIAVDPRIIPYGSKVKIPQMGVTATAIDTGGDVKARAASKKLGKNNIVIDVFCANFKIAQQRIKNYPMFMKVIVEK